MSKTPHFVFWHTLFNLFAFKSSIKSPLLHSKTTISPEFIILKNFLLFNKSKMFGFSFGDILYDDRIWQNFYLRDQEQ